MMIAFWGSLKGFEWRNESYIEEKLDETCWAETSFNCGAAAAAYPLVAVLIHCLYGTIDIRCNNCQIGR